MNPIRRYLSSCALAMLAFVPLTAQGVPLAPGVRIAHPDHHEFEAALWAPFLGEQGEARSFKVGFSFLDAESMTVGSWRLELVDAKGQVRRTWHGETFLVRGSGSQSLAWDGADTAGRPLERGFYTLRLTAKPMAQAAYRHAPGGNQVDRVEAYLAASTEDFATEETSICVGPAPRLKVRPLNLAVGAAPGSAPAPGALPYTIYIGNLHSQTNHSDGGVPVGSCSGAENPQAGVDGPTTAFEMMRGNAGGDFLMASEHNHMFDGSTGTDTNSDPADPIHNSALFASGLVLASNYRAAHPGFVALYGVEWGVISNGGHLNIFNPDGLPTWERNSSNQLLGDVDTPKSDYPNLYNTMQARGWIGQFNHPQTSQFNNLAYTANGDQVMALCEISNSGAFSTNTHEGAAPDSDTFLSNFEITFNAILEHGFHVSPTSDQDNHCSNWGLSQINRTGILVPNGTAWNMTSMLDAIRARRTFATHDKGSQIVLATSGGALMGDRINNSGSITLQVHYATVTPGRSASRIQIFEGIPGTAFSTLQMIEGTDTATITPAAGSHFYYAKITQDDGRFLWSAPIWVNQAAGAVAANIIDPSVNTSVQDGATVNFTGSATTINGSIVSHNWNFGDGQTGTGASTSNVFVNPGPGTLVRTVTYTATDNLGFTGQATRLITVQPFGTTNTNPTISDIPNQSTLKDMPITNLGFTIGDAETNANLLTVAGSSNNQTLLPDANITFGGSGTARNLTLTPAADQTGTATVTVTVTDGAGATATDTFLLTVNASGGPAGKIIISQYYEGTSFNKYIELTNVGGTPVVLTGTELFLVAINYGASGPYTDPATLVPGGTYALTGTFLPGQTRVYRHNSATLPAYAAAAATSVGTLAINFNGNDILFLSATNNLTAGQAWNARVDVVGTNAAWGGADTSWYRNPTVLNPNPTFNLAGEWTQATMATVDSALSTATQYLGTHIFSAPASISDIAGQTIEANQQAGPVNFTVGGTGTLTVTATSNNAILLPDANIVLTGSGTDTARTITATPVADQVGTAIVTVTVTDGAATTASDTFVLTVTEPNSTVTGVSVSPVNPTVNGLSTTTFTATVTGTGNFSQAVNWSATGGSINALGQWTAPNIVGPFTITATSVQNGTVSGNTSVTVVPVNTNPTISDITDKTTVQDTAIANIPFTVGDAETPVGSLTVGATSNNTTLIPNANLTFGGSGASRTLTVTPAAGLTGNATITVTVTDGGLATATDTFLVTVTPPPSKVIISQYYEGTGNDKWIEITNVGSVAVNLASPQMYMVLFSNAAADNPGASSPTSNLVLTGTLNPGTSAVFKNSSAVNPTYANGTSTSAVNFNGDDLVILSASNSGAAGVSWVARMDVVGDGTSWGTDRSFYRKPTVLGGNTTFNLPGEWTQKTLAEVNGATNLVSEYIGIHFFGTAPTISDMADLTVEINTAIPTIPFTVNDAETNPDNLAFTLSSSNTALLPIAGITVGGTGSSRTLNLTPMPGQNGTTTVTVLIRDGGNMVASDTFVLTVNAPPLALNQSVSTDEDTALAITLTATDPDNNPLTYTVVTSPSHGNLSGTAPNLTYTPSANYNGPDHFTFNANDGRVDSNIAMVSITVNPVNDAPVALDDAYTLPAGSSLLVPAPGVLGNDTDIDNPPPAPGSLSGPALHAVLVTGPAHGLLSLGPDGSFTYTPVSSYTGPDSFTYQATDGLALSNVATVHLTVTLSGPPEITSFSPAIGKVGTLVTLTGSNFAGLASVKFNGVAAAFTVLSSNQLSATVPVGATTGRITIANALGTATTSTSFTVFSLSLAPRITSFFPSSGPVGTMVTITGSLFIGVTSVTFNGVPTTFTVVSGTQIRATVPEGATTGLIAVSNSSDTGTSASQFSVR